MKKVLSIALIIVLFICLFVLSGCKKNVEEEPVEDEVIIEDKVPTLIDRSNSKLQDEEDIKKEIETASKKYFETLYEGKISDVSVKSIMVYKGDEEEMEYVDLDINDYAFQADFEIKPLSENDVEELTEYMGEYDKNTGLIKIEQTYGVMRYNVISDEYEVTSITIDSF